MKKMWIRLRSFLFTCSKFQVLLYKIRFLVQITISGGCFRKHSEKSEQFIFIVGSGRSGNTLLRRLLMEKFDIYIPPESYVLPRQINQYMISGHLKWSEKVDTILALLENHPEFETFEVNSLKDFKEEAKSWEVVEQSFLSLIIGFYRWLAVKNSIGSVWLGDKTPLNTLSLGVLNKAFPKAKFIYLERDPVDVIQSYLEAGIYDKAADASMRWRASLKAWQSFKKVKRQCDYYELKYERLITDCDEVLGEIKKQFLLPEREHLCGQLLSKMGDVSLRSHHSNVQNTPSSISIGKGRISIDEEDLTIARKILGKLPKKRGYQPL